MKTPFFEFPSYKYRVDDWDFKKRGLLKKLNNQDFKRFEPYGMYESDRGTNNKSYVRYLADLIEPQLQQFCHEAEVTCSMSDAWCVRYYKGDSQPVHNHRGWGFSGVLYVEFDPKVHLPTTFVSPWQEPRTDATNFHIPKQIQEGDMLIFPSFCLHYVSPNFVRKHRTVVSFDLLPEIPKHQSINNIA